MQALPPRDCGLGKKAQSPSQACARNCEDLGRKQGTERACQKLQTPRPKTLLLGFVVAISPQITLSLFKP